MDGMQNWTNYLEVMRNRLLLVNDADSLISVLMDVKNIPIINNRRRDRRNWIKHVIFCNLL